MTPAAAPSKPRWPKIVAIVVGVVIAAFVALVILSVLAITFLGTKSDAKFKDVGSQISAPAPRPTAALASFVG